MSGEERRSATSRTLFSFGFTSTGAQSRSGGASESARETSIRSAAASSPGGDTQAEELVDVMPVQTACVERGFSTLNRIKTKHRSSMEEGSLTALMLISSNGQCLEEWKREDAEESVRRWFSDTVGTRHIHGHRPGSGRLSKTPHSTASP